MIAAESIGDGTRPERLTLSQLFLTRLSLISSAGDAASVLAEGAQLFRQLSTCRYEKLPLQVLRIQKRNQEKSKVLETGF